MLTVVTGWSPAGYLEYGRRFAETFDKFWPEDVDLVVYGEERCDLPRGEFRLLSTIPGCMEFLDRHNNPVCRGESPAPGFEQRWKPKHHASHYNFRFDARKFSRQGFIPWHAAEMLRPLLTTQRFSHLCWLDGDVVTHARVPENFLESMLWGQEHIAYLGRGDKHSEIGFQLYKLVPDTISFLRAFKDMYVRDAVFALKEWHSAYVWDHVRKQHPFMFKDLTPGGHGHVWHQSPLRIYTDHCKGKRKEKGRSDERIR